LAPSALELVQELGTSLAVAVPMLKLTLTMAGSGMVDKVACEETWCVLGVAEVETAHPAWAMGAALGVVHGVAAPSAWCAVN
jgi:hypothetical protein